MSDSLTTAVGSFLDQIDAETASAGPAPAATTDPAPLAENATPTEATPTETDPNPDLTSSEPAAPAADPAPAPLATPAPAPARTDAEGPDVADLQSIKDRFTQDHPELQPVVDAFLKEAQRGLQRKFDALASQRKEMEASLGVAQLAQQIPQEDLLGMVQLHQLAATHPAAAADMLVAAGERLRTAAPNPNHSPAPWQNTPEWQALQQMQQTFAAQQLQGQLDQAYASLQPEFGGQAIPVNQRQHVEDECQKLGLGLEAVPMVWRSTFGVEYARQAALKQGQLLKAGKQSLAVSPAAAPAPAAVGGTEKPKSLADAVGAVCDAHRVR